LKEENFQKTLQAVIFPIVSGLRFLDMEFSSALLSRWTCECEEDNGGIIMSIAGYKIVKHRKTLGLGTGVGHLALRACSTIRLDHGCC